MFINTYVILHPVLNCQSAVSVNSFKWRMLRTLNSETCDTGSHHKHFRNLELFHSCCFNSKTKLFRGWIFTLLCITVVFLWKHVFMHPFVLPRFYTHKGKQLRVHYFPSSSTRITLAAHSNLI